MEIKISKLIQIIRNLPDPKTYPHLVFTWIVHEDQSLINHGDYSKKHTEGKELIFKIKLKLNGNHEWMLVI
jgi:hypothetical protein